MQGLLNFSWSIQEEGKFYAAAGDARISMVDVRDIAASAAAALTGSGHESHTYTLTGPEALTHADMARRMAAAVGKPIAYVEVSSEAMREALVGLDMPPWQADGLIEDYAHYRRGEAAEVAFGVRDATGMEPRAFDEFARDHAPAFA